MQFNLYLLFGWLVSLGLLEKEGQTRDVMKIRIFCQDCIGKEVSLSTSSMLRNKEVILYRSPFDSSGKSEISLPAQDTLLLFLLVDADVGHRNDTNYFLSTPLYLEPNSTLDIKYKDGALTFEGDLALVNDYLERSGSIAWQRGEFRNTHYARIRKSDNDQEKEIYLSTLQSFGTELNNEIKADQSLPTFYKDLLIARDGADEKNYLLSSEWEEFYKTRLRGGIEKLTDKRASKVFNSFSVDPYLLKAKAAYYIYHLKENIRFKLDELLFHFEYNDLHEKISRYEYIKSAIATNPKLILFRDLFLALCLTTKLEGVAYEDLYSEIDAFAKDYPRSKYLPELESILAEHGELKSGMPLKDFSMTDTTCISFNLSDLKGKLIYMDVWATWCGPCREEFKYSKQLSTKHADRNDLVFLYVSKDSESEVWENFLKKNPDLKGTHGFQALYKDRPPADDDVMQLYKISGIPRYVLIGKDGKIIDYNAARPSQLLENNYLDSLLTK